ncbi:MAG: hypothetical protein AAF483_07435 [Planctomycetota bacterium]
MRLTNWQLVRHLSQLSLLNRIAFTMLFMVPLICGLMRPVQNSATRYNDVLEGTRERMVQIELMPESVQQIVALVKDQLNLGPQPNQPTYVNLDEVQVQSLDPVRAFLVKRFPWAVDVPRLPRPWGFAFLAALLILIGDTIVQSRCPQIVRKNGIEEHVQAQGERFNKSPSVALLREARKRLAGVCKSDTDSEADKKSKSPDTALFDATELSELLAEEKEIDEKVRGKEEPSQFELESLQLVRTSIIEAASRMDYADQVKTRPVAAFISLISYCTAGILVIRILYEQTFNVLTSSGWS